MSAHAFTVYDMIANRALAEEWLDETDRGVGQSGAAGRLARIRGLRVRVLDQKGVAAVDKSELMALVAGLMPTIVNQ